MRLSEMTDEQLIKQVEDDALAREIFNRLVLSKLRVSDEVQALEHQRDKIQGDYERAMGRVGQLESAFADVSALITQIHDALHYGEIYQWNDGSECWQTMDRFVEKTDA